MVRQRVRSLTGWKPIRGFPAYEVSGSGNVRRRSDGRFVRPFAMKNGYLHVKLRRDDGTWITKAVHVLACKAFHGRRPTARHEVSHRDGTRKNNRASNLCWATKAQNQQDRVRHGTSNRGERSGTHKLSEYEVKMVRQLARIPAEVFARQLGVTHGTITAIRRRATWTWLK